MTDRELIDLRRRWYRGDLSYAEFHRLTRNVSGERYDWVFRKVCNLLMVKTVVLVILNVALMGLVVLLPAPWDRVVAVPYAVSVSLTICWAACGIQQCFCCQLEVRDYWEAAQVGRYRGPHVVSRQPD